jgi:hypothetical protein
MSRIKSDNQGFQALKLQNSEAEELGSSDVLFSDLMAAPTGMFHHVGAAIVIQGWIAGQ